MLANPARHTHSEGTLFQECLYPSFHVSCHPGNIIDLFHEPLVGDGVICFLNVQSNANRGRILRGNVLEAQKTGARPSVGPAPFVVCLTKLESLLAKTRSKTLPSWLSRVIGLYDPFDFLIG